MVDQNKELQAQEVAKQEVETEGGVERTRTGKCYVPRVDIYETGEGLVLLADIPGVDENSVDITLEKNILTLKGAVEFEQPENYGPAYAEYEIGDYERSFTLSDEIDQDNIRASVKNGVLRLLLPKAGPVQARKIAVKGM